MSIRRLMVTVVAVLPLLLLTACDLDTVAEVKADPYKFTKDTVHLGGVVTQSYGVLGYGVYEIEDKTGKIFVVAQGGRGVPGKGARIEVKGRARTGFSIAGIDYGTIIMESSRKLHD